MVFWCDLYRGQRPDYDKLKVHRDHIALGGAAEKPNEQSLRWQQISGCIANEASADQKRLWYVAATRAGERLVLSGIPQGGTRNTAGAPALELLALFPQLAQPGVAGVEYQGLGASFTMRVTHASPSLLTSAADEMPLGLSDMLPSPHASMSAPVGRGRHSATELMAQPRCEQKHWFKYIAGLPEPALEGRGRRKDELIAAVTKGQIVHDVLEHLAECVRRARREDGQAW